MHFDAKFYLVHFNYLPRLIVFTKYSIKSKTMLEIKCHFPINSIGNGYRELRLFTWIATFIALVIILSYVASFYN